MKAKAKYTLGSIEFEFESEATDLKEQIFQLMDLQPRRKCDVCGNTQYFGLFKNEAESKKDKKMYKYIKVVCTAKVEGQEKPCYAQSTLGTLTDNKGYFWRKFERFEAKEDK